MATDEPPKHQMIKTAGTTAVVSAAGAGAGLALDAMILFSFGAGHQTDAFFAALVIPALLVSIVSIQGPKILVPVFSALFSKEDHAAWILLRNLATASGLAFAAVAIVGAGLSRWTMPMQVPGLDPAAMALAAKLTRVLFVLVFFQGLSAVLQAVLYARQSYLVAASGKLITNTVAVVVILVCGPDGLSIETVALALILGGIANLLVLGVVLGKHGFTYRWALDFRDPRLRGIVRSFSYPLCGHVLGESSVIVQSVVGSILGSGSLTLIHYALRIIGAIGGILLGSVVQITLPMIAKHAVTANIGLQRRTLLESIQLLGLVAVPLSVWLLFMAEPLVVLCFQRGQFSALDAMSTAAIIRAMVPYFLLTRFVSVTQTLFYANADLRTPFISTIIFTVTNTVLAPILAGALGEPGVGLAVSFASMSNALYMLLRLRTRFKPLGWHSMWTFGRGLLSTTVVTGASFAAGIKLLSVMPVSGPLSRIVALAVPSAFGFSVFLTGVIVLRLVGPRSRSVLPGQLTA